MDTSRLVLWLCEDFSMTNNQDVLRAIDWRSIFPWLVIFRTFRLAKSLPVIALATIGAWLTPLGWHLGETLFVSDTPAELRMVVEANGVWPGECRALPAPNQGRIPTSPQEMLFTSPDTLQPLYLRFVQPVARLINARISAAEAGYYATGLLWNLIVWGLIGGAITRIACVRLGREEQIGLGEAIGFAAKRLGWYIAGPLFPLVGVAVMAVPILLLGLLMHFEWGVLVAGLFWIFATVGGLIIAVLLIGLLFGWPLMWPTISAEQQGDAFEAFSRSYSYVFQRPLHYLFYALVASVFGALSWLLVYHFAEAVITLTAWPAAIGAGDSWMNVQTAVNGMNHSPHPLVGWGGTIIGWCAIFVRSIATGFAYGFFWCVASAVYLLLRLDVDQTEFDEVYVANEDRSYQLPELEAASGKQEEKPQA